ncbi:MAG: SpoIIIAH-like family protein [Oscillospiraceae bacterium]|nr:SpoIIIAH-like family protein [Oscillospiraceae bacterium]
MKNIQKQRKASLIILSFAMIVAVYLNWQYSRAGADTYILTDEITQQVNTRINDESDLLKTEEDYETQNYGDAQLVATTKTDSDKYFEQARLSRQKTRDEALDTLQKTLKNTKLSDIDKKQATEKLSQIIQNMTNETDIENMLKAKGFRDCVASISDNKISLAVRPVKGELSKADVSKIRDVVLSKTSISSQNIVVVEVN